MVILIPIEQSDFEAFKEYGINDYAQEKIISGNWRPEEALEKSREEFQRLLPNGLQTKDNYLFTILDKVNSRKIGVLWIQIKSDSPHRDAFICDFVIEQQFRGLGYGKQALQALDEKLIEMNVENINLHVFAHNTTAINLYNKMGFITTNLFMNKKLAVRVKNN